jgi:hypothetical protein
METINKTDVIGKKISANLLALIGDFFFFSISTFSPIRA